MTIQERYKPFHDFSVDGMGWTLRDDVIAEYDGQHLSLRSPTGATMALTRGVELVDGETRYPAVPFLLDKLRTQGIVIHTP